MSDSGKISLPTPERIEEIKRMAKFQHPLSVGIVTNGEFLELLAALEESQQQLTLERDRTNYWGEREGTAKLDLIEAQQTIARLDQYAGAVESILDRARDAISDEDKIGYQHGLKDIISTARAALGNKEGSDKA